MIARVEVNRGNLSGRAFQCLGYVAVGLTNKEIGSRLQISPRTVEIYVLHAPLPLTGFVDLDRSVVRFFDSPVSAKLLVIALIGASAALLLHILSERADRN